MSWRTLFPLIFILTLVDGFLSNMYPNFQAMLLLKDFLILLVLFFFSMKERMSEHTRLLKQTLGNQVWFLAAGLVVLGFFQIFNPLSPGVLRGILGFKVMFYYWVLAVL